MITKIKDFLIELLAASLTFGLILITFIVVGGILLLLNVSLANENLGLFTLMLALLMSILYWVAGEWEKWINSK
jgi:hypothetical protein